MSKNSKKKRDLKKKKMAKTKNLKAQPNSLKKLSIFRKKYTKEWDITSSFFDAEGHYAWMSGQMTNYDHILEIGCGVGYSTLSLLKDGHSVVSVEENPECINLTKELLEKNGFSVTTIQRERIISKGEEKYKILYSDINLNDVESSDALLIEGDALKDKKLTQWLSKNKKYDGVVCWLLGTHSYRGHNTCMDLFQISNSSDHRLLVQNMVYELADIILRSKGVLNIIDRAQLPDTKELREDLINSHKEQASVTDLIVNELTHREYKESEKDGATQMVVRLSAESKGFNPNKTALTSITSVKP